MKRRYYYTHPLRHAVAALSLALLVSGCMPGAGNQPELHACLDKCDARFMGLRQEKWACEQACMAPARNNIVTTASGPYTFDAGKNALNEGNSTATLR